jgi:hypothetical protein
MLFKRLVRKKTLEFLDVKAIDDELTVAEKLELFRCNNQYPLLRVSAIEDQDFQRI